MDLRVKFKLRRIRESTGFFLTICFLPREENLAAVMESISLSPCPQDPSNPFPDV
jgi:hypothetical protein